MDKYFEYLKYEFTRREIQELGTELARATQEAAELEQRKKEITASLKSEIEAKAGTMARLARLVTTGYEHRDVECAVKFHEPKTGVKTIIRLDTGETVRVDPMTEKELQQSLPFEVVNGSGDPLPAA